MAIRNPSAHAALPYPNDPSDRIHGTEHASRAHDPSSIDTPSRLGDSAIDRVNVARRRLSRLLVAGCLGLALSTSSGCSTFSGACKTFQGQGCIDEFMLNHRHRVMAARAWYRESACMKDHCHLKHVKRGFMDAYAEVAAGGPGCVPAIAPRDYWGWRYQSADGNGAVNAWFEGYPLGVKAAEQDGMVNSNQISMSQFSTQTRATSPGAVAAGTTAANPTGQPVAVPGGYINAKGEFVDHNGNVIGTGTVEDRAVGEAEAESDGGLFDAPADMPASNAPAIDAPTPDALDRLDDDLSYQSEAYQSEADGSAVVELDDNTYRFGDPSEQEIDAVIDDIFGKPQSEASADASNDSNLQSIPFTFE